MYEPDSLCTALQYKHEFIQHLPFQSKGKDVHFHINVQKILHTNNFTNPYITFN